MEELITGNRVDIRPGVADRSTEQNAVLFQKIHGFHNCGVVAVSTASVIGLLCSLNRKEESHVSKLYQLFAEFLVDQRRIRERGKVAVIVFLNQPENIFFPHHRLSTGHEIKIHAELLALGNNLVHILKGQVIFMSVGSGPASGTVHIAGGCRIEQNQPRDIAVVFFPVLPNCLGSPKKCLVTKIQKRHLGKLRIDFIDRFINKLHPAVVRILDCCLDRSDFLRCERLSEEFFRKIHELQISFSLVRTFLYISNQTINDNTNRLTLCCMSQFLNF